MTIAERSGEHRAGMRAERVSVEHEEGRYKCELASIYTIYPELKKTGESEAFSRKTRTTI